MEVDGIKEPGEGIINYMVSLLEYILPERASKVAFN